jgi:hypothetical protein
MLMIRYKIDRIVDSSLKGRDGFMHCNHAVLGSRPKNKASYLHNPPRAFSARRFPVILIRDFSQPEHTLVLFWDIFSQSRSYKGGSGEEI